VVEAVDATQVALALVALAVAALAVHLVAELQGLLTLVAVAAVAIVVLEQAAQELFTLGSGYDRSVFCST
jgi:hypothetical protein